jgi:hypothetical protein
MILRFPFWQLSGSDSSIVSLSVLYKSSALIPDIANGLAYGEPLKVFSRAAAVSRDLFRHRGSQV